MKVKNNTPLSDHDLDSPSKVKNDTPDATHTLSCIFPCEADNVRTVLTRLVRWYLVIYVSQLRWHRLISYNLPAFSEQRARREWFDHHIHSPAREILLYSLPSQSSFLV